MKTNLLYISIILLTGCGVKAPTTLPRSEVKTPKQEEIQKGWQVVGPQIQGMKNLKVDFDLYQFGDDEVYMLPTSGCILDYTYEKATNKLNKKKTCESLIYRVTENGLVKLPGVSLEESLASLTKWNGKLLLATQKAEPSTGNKVLTHVIIYELDEVNNNWKVLAPYGFTKEFYPQKNGNGLTYTEIGGIPGGPLYLIYGDPYVKMIKYENGKWSFAHSKKASQGGIAGERGQVIGNELYYSFQDYGHDNIGPHIKRVDANGNLKDLGGFPFTKATNSNVAFSGDGNNFILLTGKARKEGEKFGKYELRTLVNNKWEPISTAGLPNNLSHYWTYTYNGEFYISARIAPLGSVYQAKASVYKFNGTSWVPVGNKNFTTLMPNFPKVFALKGSLYCIYSNQKEGGYTMMKLIEP